MKTRLIPFQLSKLDDFEGFKVVRKTTGKPLDLKIEGIVIDNKGMVMVINDGNQPLPLPIDRRGEIRLDKDEYFSGFQIMMEIKDESSKEEPCKKESCEEEKSEKKRVLKTTVIEVDGNTNLSDIFRELNDLLNEMKK